MDFDTLTVGELVAQDYRWASVFKKHGIDFCCGGGKTINAACKKKGINAAELEAQFYATEQQAQSAGNVNPSGWELDFLADFIVNVHHRYVRENAPLIQEFIRKVARVHGHAQPETVQIAGLFDELAAEMAAHMAKEEEVLFPHVKKLAAAAREGGVPEQPGFGTVRNPVQAMEDEHERAGALMAQIRALSSDFTPPEYACNTYRVAYAKLHEFEEDLHRHVHLENNILFPKTIALEGQAAPATQA